ncbi:MAG: UDP-N-acetylmuramate dehydrogenase [Candidatus Paceibacterota bacterium]
MDAWKQQEPLALYTTIKIGGPAEYFVTVPSVENLIACVHEANTRHQPITILGGGSNILVPDAGVRGVVVQNAITGVSYKEADDEVFVEVGAGVSWDSLVAEVVERGLWGIENLSGIPGSVGGAVVQNINAYGVTLADLIVEVSAVDLTNKSVTRFTQPECEFEYRNSFFKRPGAGKEYAVTGVTLKLSKKPIVHSTYRSATQSLEQKLKEKGIVEPSPDHVRTEILSIRSNIGMLEGMFNSAGSFFTNPVISREAFKRVEAKVVEQYKAVSDAFEPWHWPVGTEQEKISAAFLMECTPYNKTAFRDKSFNGTVGISPVHTLSIINLGDASAEDVRQFAEKISDKVREEFEIEFRSEVCFL